MRSSIKVVLAVIAGFIAFLAITGLIGSAVIADPRLRTNVLLAVWVVGLVVTVVLLVYLTRPRKTPAAVPSDASREIDATIAAAKKHLAGSRRGRKASPATLPMVLILGPTGAAKTTSLIRSGIDAELLAGEVLRGETVAPTRSINAWFARDTVFVEAGGGVTADAARWSSLLRHAQPRRLGAAFGGGAQAPRQAVVCISCEEFVNPGAAANVAALAQTLRARLFEATQRLGVRLPVYVLFTKLDKIPYFEDFVRTFSKDESREPLGATITADTEPAGSYADRQTQRVHHALDELFRSLVERRLIVLGREANSEKTAGTYEFPREFRKIAPLVVQFLVDLCKPSQLQVSPLLRGFYFTGVQAVFVTEQAAAPVASSVLQSDATSNATSVFRRPVLQPSSAPAAAAAVTRKLPRWDFLERIFPDVILADRAAMGVTGGGTRVSFLRRASIATLVALLLVVNLGLVVSFFGNRSLASRTRAAMLAVARDTARTDAPPALDALKRLDTLRAIVDTLGRNARQGARLRLRWGLYDARRPYDAARAAHGVAFGRLLYDQAKTALARRLQTLPERPAATDSFPQTYALLKTYLVTTDFPDSSADSSTARMVADALTAQWRFATRADSARSELAARQFEFLARELPYGKFDNSRADVAIRARARGFLAGFEGADFIYANMIAAAPDSLRKNPVRFPRQDVGDVLAATYAVPGVYSRAGWKWMQGSFAHIDRYVNTERWVVGDRQTAPLDRATVEREIRVRYARDYVAAWTRYLQEARVVRAATLPDADVKLVKLSAQPWAMFDLLRVAARETAIDDSSVAKRFEKLHALMPADTAKPASPEKGAYIKALADLAPSLAAAGKATSATDPSIADARAKLTSANGALNGINSSVGLDDPVRVFLVAPITRADALLNDKLASLAPAGGGGGGGGAGPDLAAARTAAANVCQQFNTQLGTKFPFNQDAPASSGPPLPLVSALFHPETGAVNEFLKGAGQTLVALSPEGRYEQRASIAGPRLTPGFLRFLDDANTFTKALYDRGRVRVDFHLRAQIPTAPGSGVSFTLGDKTVRFRSGETDSDFEWEGAAVAAAVRELTRNRSFGTSGPWALLELFHDPRASVNSLGPSTFDVRFDVSGGLGTDTPTPSFVLSGRSASIFSGRFFRDFTCPMPIAR